MGLRDGVKGEEGRPEGNINLFMGTYLPGSAWSLNRKICFLPLPESFWIGSGVTSTLTSGLSVLVSGLRDFENMIGWAVSEPFLQVPTKGGDRWRVLTAAEEGT